MATPTKGGIIREFSSAVMDRITGRGAARLLNPEQTSGATDAELRAGFQPAQQFFPSGMPITPVAPIVAAGRSRDFPPYSNQSYQPRSEQGENSISFQALQRMASPADGGLDILRLAIETRKDQMAAQRWSIRGRKKDDDGGPAARKVEAWLANPDGVHTFRQWMRMLLEDHFVIDAPSIYMGRTGSRPLFEIVHGATIKQLITADDGRTPLPPLPAYQQILVGMPAVNYTIEELAYYPYNLLPRRQYGMSRVEQVVATIRLALERSVSQIDYYTTGTTPDGFLSLPSDWTTEQIQAYSEYFNSVMEGQSAERRKIQFVPGGSVYTATKDLILKDAMDEWIARIVCYNFSLSPQTLVKEMNRATSETAKRSGQEEGLEPTKLWFKDMINDLLRRVDAPQLEFYWEDEEIVDPLMKSQVIMAYRGGNGAPPLITLEEGRKLAGFSPASPEQLAELRLGAGSPAAASANPDDGGPPPDDGSLIDTPEPSREEAVTKAARGGRSLPAARAQRRSKI